MALYRVIPSRSIQLVKDENGKTQMVLLTGVPFVRQKLQQRLRFFLGEWFRNLAEGVPYYRYALVKNPDFNLIQEVFTRAIMSVQEVTKVENLTFNWDKKNRTLAIGFKAQLVDGGVLQVRQPDPAFIITLTPTQ